jgi:surface polysaccharide O-acyltransferase-like enzyme
LAEPVAIPAWVHAFCGLAVLTAIGTHVTADASGQPFPYNSPDQRLPALLGRAVFTALDYPALILAFLLVLARLMTSGGTSARDVTRAFVRRLLAPFLFWSIAFLLIRHGKAFAFGYGEAYRGELASGLSWLRYALLGGAQYHLFLIPLFLVLGFISPVFRGASNRPALGALLPLTLALWPFLGGLAYDRIGSPDVRAYALFGAEAFAFLGYGFFAFMVAGKGFESLSRSKRAAVAWAASAVIAVGLALLVAHALREAEAGRWLPLSLPAHLGRYLVPAAALVLFRFCENVRFPAWFLRVGQLSFGIYLIHPAALDAMEILERGLALPPGLLAALNLAAVSLLSVLAVAALSRIPFLQFSVRPDRGGAR